MEKDQKQQNEQAQTSEQSERSSTNPQEREKFPLKFNIDVEYSKEGYLKKDLELAGLGGADGIIALVCTRLTAPTLGDNRPIYKPLGIFSKGVDGQPLTINELVDGWIMQGALIYQGALAPNSFVSEENLKFLEGLYKQAKDGQ